VHVLCDSALGQALLAIGSILACAGTAWSARLTDRAVPR